jgi:phage-related protein
MADNFGLKIGLEGEKEFKASLAQINQSFKVLGSEMKLVDSQFDKNDTSVQALTARNGVLEKSIEAQKTKIDVLRSALNNAAESFGENDKRTQSWQIQLNNAQAELNKMEKELKENKSALESTGDEMDKTKKSADKMGDEIEDVGEQADDSSSKMEALGSVCKTASVAMAAAFAAVTAAAVAAGKALVDMTKEGAAFADSVLTQSTVTGISTEKLQEYMYAAELVDVSVETLTGSMKKNINAMKKAQEGSSTYVEAYEKLGVEVMNADGTLRDSEEVYWEIIEALGKVENETERDALAMALLGKSATDLNPLIEAGAEKMEELADKAHDAGYVMSDEMLSAYGKLDDQLQYLSVGTTAMKNALGTILLPILTDLATDGVSLLGEFTNGIRECDGDISKMSGVISEVLPKFLGMILQYIPQIMDLAMIIVSSIGTAIMDNLDIIIDTATKIVLSLLNGLISALPKIAEGALKLVLTLVKGLLANLPKILQAAVQVVVTLAKGIAAALPELVPTIVSVVVELCQTLVDNLPLILDAALQLITGLAEGLIEAIPILLEALPELIISIVDFLVGAIPQIIETGITLFTSIIDALPEIIQTIITAIPQIINGIITAIVESLPLIIQAGINLFTSIIQALPEIIEMILTAIPTIISSIINALISNLPLLINAGVQLFTSLIANLPTIIIEIVKAVPQILSSIINGFATGFSQMADVGKNLVKGLWEGIQSLAGWIWDKVSSWASDLWDGIKNFFGIHSPSKKMSWIGDMLMEGLAGGIDESASDVIDSANSMTKDLNSVFNDLSADMSGVPTNFNVSSTTGTIRDGIKQASSGLTLQLQIENFNNYSNEDINSLTEEIMETAASFTRRKGVIYG